MELRSDGNGRKIPHIIEISHTGIHMLRGWMVDIDHT